MFKPYTYQREEVHYEPEVFEEEQENLDWEDMNYGWTQEEQDYSKF